MASSPTPRGHALGPQGRCRVQAFVEVTPRPAADCCFGRVTYELMAGYWPTPLAAQQNPIVARRMNDLPKVVFSRSMTAASWSNTLLVRADMPAAVRAMKAEPGPTW